MLLHFLHGSHPARTFGRQKPTPGPLKFIPAHSEKLADIDNCYKKFTPGVSQAAKNIIGLKWKAHIKPASVSESRIPHSLPSTQGSFYRLGKTDGTIERFDSNGLHLEELSQLVPTEGKLDGFSNQ